MTYPTNPQYAQPTVEHAAAIGAAVPQDRQPEYNPIVQFTFRGIPLAVDLRNFTLDTADHFESNRAATGLRALFGDEQFELLRSLQLSEIGELFAEIKRAQGPKG